MASPIRTRRVTSLIQGTPPDLPPYDDQLVVFQDFGHLIQCNHMISHSPREEFPTRWRSRNSWSAALVEFDPGAGDD